LKRGIKAIDKAGSQPSLRPSKSKRNSNKGRENHTRIKSSI